MCSGHLFYGLFHIYSLFTDLDLRYIIREFLLVMDFLYLFIYLAC